MSNKDVRRQAVNGDAMKADIQTALECFMLAAIALERGLDRVGRWRSKVLLPSSAIGPAATSPMRFWTAPT